MDSLTRLHARTVFVRLICQNWHISRWSVICSYNARIKTVLPKPLVWVGSSVKDLRKFPDDVKRIMGHVLYFAQQGDKHMDAKPLEVVEDHKGDTYRAVYTVKFEGKIYVLHCFQKKSKKGIATPKPDMDLIKDRFKEARRLHNGDGQ
ncbi:MAG: type II toxin-antitoxin system RelE/ParE family toxin [Sedimenticola sp.]